MSTGRNIFNLCNGVPDLQKYCGIMPCYGSPTYCYIRLGMSISIWQQLIYKVFENIANRERYKIIMDDGRFAQEETNNLHIWQIPSSID